MPRAYGLLRAGFPYLKTIGMRRVTNTPVDVAIDSDGVVYVLGRAGEITKLSIEDDILGVLAGGGSDEGKFTWPVALALDHDENLVVSDEALNRITTLTKNGEVVCTWGDPGSGEGQLNRPAGVAADAEGNVYVADAMNHRIQKFTGEGEYILGWGRQGSAEGELDMPWGLAVDDEGCVFVADWRNDRIQKFTSEGELVFALGSSGDGEGQFRRPAGVTTDGDGDIYVADTGNNRVQQFSEDCRYVDRFIGDATLSKLAREYMMSNGKPNRLREMSVLEPQKRLRSPRSVELDSEGRMFIPDYMSFRVQVYQKEVIPLGPSGINPPFRSPTLQVT